MTTLTRTAGVRLRLQCSVAILVSCCPIATFAQDITVLDLIVVEGNINDTSVQTLSGGETVLLEGEAVSDSYTGDVATALRSVPGVFTRSPGDNPAVTVNIRGMQGLGRVNTMIDGIPQTFRNMSGHGGSYDDQVFVDPGLVAGADVAKGAVAGPAGMGALAGAANFRTIGIDDVLDGEKRVGGMLKFSAGTNGYGPHVTAAGAMQGNFATGGDWGTMLAISGYENGQYADGDGTKSSEYTQDEPLTILAKARFRPSDALEINVAAQDYNNKMFPASSSGYIWDMERQSVSADLRYNPASELIDITASAYWQDFSFDFPEGEGRSSTGSYIGREGTDISKGFSVSNSSRISPDLRLDYGLAWSNNDYDVNELGGTNGSGELDKLGAFLQASYQMGAWDFGAGLRYDTWELSGEIPETVNNLTTVVPLDNSGEELLPNLSARYHFSDALSTYASYAKTMRAPTATEMFYGVNGNAHTGGGTTIRVNPDLDSEKAETFEIGVNYATELYNVSASAFQSNVEDFIVFETDSDNTVRFINVPGKTTLRGIELAGGFETERFFGTLSVTLSDTDQPASQQAGGGHDQYGELPNEYLTLDLGVKFQGDDGRIGARMRYVGDSVVARYTSFTDMTAMMIDKPSYTLFDLYGTYQVSETAELFASVENVFDTYYVEANSGDTSLNGGIGGRGRTFTLGATFRF
ncbi:TonB-dependent receptor domain-containing protein [Celeribacter sp. PS-C1]|uniref:TonB-dependent receptor domain-containing protein n=1 Tax=Celeribacter sp. PS-C1 TaxID=2820813 RepID=UPI001CA57A6C|nr:TonB-dependent receptor [Celeribacter sp. PS-C1]MBW6417495.1 TonB-dependent receptor [Celeribacter sp. PS-C1]